MSRVRPGYFMPVEKRQLSSLSAQSCSYYVIEYYIYNTVKSMLTFVLVIMFNFTYYSMFSFLLSTPNSQLFFLIFCIAYLIVVFQLYLWSNISLVFIKFCCLYRDIFLLLPLHSAGCFSLCVTLVN